MKAKIIIILSIVITVSISVFIFTQNEMIEKQPASQSTDEMIEKQPASQSTDDERIKNLLKKVEDSRIASELSGEYDMNKPREWITSGPFQIDRSVYHLGEKIFINVEQIRSDAKTEMVFGKIINDTHVHTYKILSFDGMQQQQNMYFAMFPSMPGGFCTVDDLLGDWEVSFPSTNLKPLNFEIINKFVPGNENYFDPVC